MLYVYCIFTIKLAKGNIIKKIKRKIYLIFINGILNIISGSGSY